MDSEVPARLGRLVSSGVWRTRDYVDSRIEPSVAKRWDPLADGIHLNDELQSVADAIRVAPEMRIHWPSEGPDYERCLIIADFGLGSDNPIVLDLTRTPAPVLTVDFHDGRNPRQPSNWFKIADDFDQFLDYLGLD